MAGEFARRVERSGTIAQQLRFVLGPVGIIVARVDGREPLVARALTRTETEIRVKAILARCGRPVRQSTLREVETPRGSDGRPGGRLMPALLVARELVDGRLPLESRLALQ